MDNLTYHLKQMCRHNRDGSKSTQANRQAILFMISGQLKEAGFKHMSAQSLKTKHIEHLIQRWHTEELQASTLKNRLAHLRWWADKIGKPGLIPKDNTELGIDRRHYITDINKAKTLEVQQLERITDHHVKLSLQLQAAFGLRREEAIKFQPHYADQKDHLTLKASWCKGGKERTIPIQTPEQQVLLHQIHQLAKDGSLIPEHKNYKQQLHTYEGQCKRAGLSSMHGLRHHYAQTRYQELTGWKAPKAGGPSTKHLTPEQKIRDTQARQTISREMGHERLEVTRVYLG